MIKILEKATITQKAAKDFLEQRGSHPAESFYLAVLLSQVSFVQNESEILDGVKPEAALFRLGR